MKQYPESDSMVLDSILNPNHIESPEEGDVFGEHSHLYRNVPIEYIRIDKTYQRPISDSHIKRIFKEFDPKFFGTLLVSRREDGLCYIIDGQHRFEVARMRDLTHVPCEVLDGLTLAEEAEIFNKVSVNRKSLTAKDIFKLEIHQGDQRAIEIREVIYKNGYHIYLDGPSTGGGIKGRISCFSALKFVYQLGGKELLDAALYIIKKCWGDNPEALNRMFVQGMARFIKTAKEQGKQSFSLDRVSERLRTIPPFEIHQRAKLFARTLDSSRSGRAYERVFIEAYNKKLKPTNKVLVPLD